jgi:hypothetical protein
MGSRTDVVTRDKKLKGTADYLTEEARFDFYEISRFLEALEPRWQKIAKMVTVLRPLDY